MTELSQASDLKQAIHLLDQAANIMYKLDVRVSDFNAVQGVLASLEADLTELVSPSEV